MIQLSKRLQAVVDFVKENKTVADIGTDHGYVPIYLIENKICAKAIAMDVNAGPLAKANIHIKEHRLDAYIESRRSDGLKELSVGEADTIIIAGMGGMLMKKILTEGATVLQNVKEIVLQPQSEWMEIRRFLAENKFHIWEEEMVYEDEKYYPVLYIRKEEREKPCAILASDDVALKYGPCLLEKKHPILERYLLEQKEKKEKVLTQILKNAAKQNKQKELEKISREISHIQKGLRIVENSENEVKYVM